MAVKQSNNCLRLFQQVFLRDWYLSLVELWELAVSFSFIATERRF